MPNMHGVRWCETQGEIQQWHIPMPEEERDRYDETIRFETITRVGLIPYTAVYFKIIIAYRVSWLRANYFLTVHLLTLNPLCVADCNCPSSFAKNVNTHLPINPPILYQALIR